MARLAMTSLAFMLVEVPEPVWKMSSTNSAVPLSIGDLLGGLDDGRGQFRFESAQFLVGQGGVLFDQAQRADEGARETQVADGKILHGPRRLRAVIGAGGDLHRPHGIAFSSELFVHKS